jgi:anti-sigma B factor antagonist/stage II sporulation protein AA (anti-sigma F factor antagonist)
MSADPDQGAFRPPRFEVTVDEEPGGLLVKAAGELDLVSEPEFNAALEQVRGKPAVVDLSELAFMDSTGLRAVLGAARTHPQLKLRGPLQPPVQRLLELTQTLELLPFETG